MSKYKLVTLHVYYRLTDTYISCMDGHIDIWTDPNCILTRNLVRNFCLKCWVRYPVLLDIRPDLGFRYYRAGYPDIDIIWPDIRTGRIPDFDIIRPDIRTGRIFSLVLLKLSGRISDILILKSSGRISGQVKYPAQP